MSFTVLDENDVRRIVREEARPIYVTQKTVKAVLGLEPRDYLRDARARVFPSTTKHRKIIARTADVIAAIELALSHRDAKPANDSNAEAIALARVKARRVG